MKYYLAIDIGASSGRHIIGWKENGELCTQEVYRFSNGVVPSDGHLIWDISSLFENIQKGIDAALQSFPVIESLSIDTWGVDYVLMNGEQEILPCYAYRDTRTEAVIPKLHEIIPFSDLYQITGSQFQSFNTIYQLYADQLCGRLENATDYLMMPEYLMYKLCGAKVHEYTNATTTGMIAASTGCFSEEIIEKLKFPPHLFTPPHKPGEIIGSYKGIKVVLCATHDTGSAVEGIPMEGNELYISSGTWSLLGVKTPLPICDKNSEAANYSNEGGVNYNRYQKNIMGMWLVNRLKDELCPDETFPEIVRQAQNSDCNLKVDANAAAFLSPVSMKEAFDQAIGEASLTKYDYFKIAYVSLAESYKAAIQEVEQNTGNTYQKLYIVGGGAKNQYLNELTQKATGKEVIALPIEATAIGNLKIQMEVSYELS